MKKTFIVLSFAILAGGQIMAQKDSASHKMEKDNASMGSTKYFYYPESNVYFNEANSNYSYYDPATSTWSTNSQLPSTYSIDKSTQKSELTYKGNGDVWTDNAAHKKQYGSKINSQPVKP